MSQAFDVAEAKSRFSELLNRATYSRERFLIRKRGKPVAAIVSAEDLARLEGQSTPGEGLIGAVGLLADFPDWERAIDEVIESRQSQLPRPVDLD